MTTLAISKTTDGVETLIGTLTFDESNNATLSLEADGPQAERLRQAWDETSKLSSVTMQRTVRKEVNGETVSAYRSIPVSKGDDRYPDAVWSHLEIEYGYLVDQK